MGMTLEGVSEVSGEVGVSVEGEGKEGVTDAFIDGLNKALTKRVYGFLLSSNNQKLYDMLIKIFEKVYQLEIEE